MSAIGMVVRSVCLVAPIGSGLAASVSPAPTTCSPSTGDIISFMAGPSLESRVEVWDGRRGGVRRRRGDRRGHGGRLGGLGNLGEFLDATGARGRFDAAHLSARPAHANDGATTGELLDIFDGNCPLGANNFEKSDLGVSAYN